MNLEQQFTNAKERLRATLRSLPTTIDEPWYREYQECRQAIEARKEQTESRKRVLLEAKIKLEAFLNETIQIESRVKDQQSQSPKDSPLSAINKRLSQVQTLQELGAAIYTAYLAGELDVLPVMQPRIDLGNELTELEKAGRTIWRSTQIMFKKTQVAPADLKLGRDIAEAGMLDVVWCRSTEHVLAKLGVKKDGHAAQEEQQQEKELKRIAESVRGICEEANLGHSNSPHDAIASLNVEFQELEESLKEISGQETMLSEAVVDTLIGRDELSDVVANSLIGGVAKEVRRLSVELRDAKQIQCNVQLEKASDDLTATTLESRRTSFEQDDAQQGQGRDQPNRVSDETGTDTEIKNHDETKLEKPRHSPDAESHRQSLTTSNAKPSKPSTTSSDPPKKKGLFAKVWDFVFKPKCPKCNESAGVVKLSKLLNKHQEVRTTPGRTSLTGNDTPAKQETYNVQTYLKTYQCESCGNLWEKIEESSSIA